MKQKYPVCTKHRKRRIGKLFLFLVFGLLNLFSNAQDCDASFVPPCNINGIEVTSSSTGSSTIYNSPFTSCSSVTTLTNSVWLGSYGPFTYTVNFSKPINKLVIILTATGNPIDENFIFNTNGGTPTITSSKSCFSRIEGNQIFSGLDSPGEGGGGIFTIKSPANFTSITISGDGGSNGSIFTFCANSVSSNCTASSLVPAFKETKVSPACGSSKTSLKNLKPTNSVKGLSLSWHTEAIPGKSNLIREELLSAGTYYAAFYDKENDCYSSATTPVEITSASGPQVVAGEDRTICSGDPLVLTASGAVSYKWDQGVVQGQSFFPKASQTYTVTGTDASGCSNSDQIVVSIKEHPKVFAGEDLVITRGDRITLKASGADTYSWDYGIVQGISFIPDSSQTYTVTGTDQHGCSNTDQVVVTVKKAISHALKDIAPEDFDPVYFNPVNVVFVLDVSNSMAAYNKIELLKASMAGLLGIIRPQDKITLVSYSSEASVLMSSKSGDEITSIKETVSKLRAFGHTAGNEGIKLGFREAKKAFIENGTNIVVVITDGAFDRSPGNYLKVIEKYQKLHINLSVVGIKNAPEDEQNMREAAAAGHGVYIPIFKPIDTKLSLMLEIKKQAYKNVGVLY